MKNENYHALNTAVGSTVLLGGYMATLWLGKLAVAMAITGRGDNGDNPPWLGFYYGSWLPQMRWNGGRFNRREVVDIGWNWLCFHGSWTWWSGGGNWFWNIRPKTPNATELSGGTPK